MSKRNREKRNSTRLNETRVPEPRIETSLDETHEPETPHNWPHGHVNAKLTSLDEDECVIVTIHGVRHYLHATTGAALQEMLAAAIDEYNLLVGAMNREHGTHIPLV